MKVLAYRYFVGMSLEAVGKEIPNAVTGDGRITRERVRQLEAYAFRKLRRKPKTEW